MHFDRTLARAKYNTHKSQIRIRSCHRRPRILILCARRNYNFNNTTIIHVLTRTRCQLVPRATRTCASSFEWKAPLRAITLQKHISRWNTKETGKNFHLKIFHELFPLKTVHFIFRFLFILKTRYQRNLLLSTIYNRFYRFTNTTYRI